MTFGLYRAWCPSIQGLTIHIHDTLDGALPAEFTKISDMAARGLHPHADVLERFTRCGETFPELERQRTSGIDNDLERIGNDRLATGSSGDDAALETRTSRKKTNEGLPDQLERSSSEHRQDVARKASKGAPQLSNLL